MYCANCLLQTWQIIRVEDGFKGDDFEVSDVTIVFSGIILRDDSKLGFSREKKRSEKSNTLICKSVIGPGCR